ncbi:TPA: FkbM family methyltransferase [Vibrio cholerae]
MFVIDVGANHGEFSLEVAKRNIELKVVSIEPISELCDKISNEKKRHNIDNIYIYQCAIDEHERLATLNVSTHTDWGISSLLEFDDVKLNNEYWSTREDIYFDKQEEVSVRTLSSLCSELGVSKENRIDFIKIDAQGLDLEVLSSAGNYISCIDFGMMEVSVSLELGLYKKEKNDLRIVLDWLNYNDFEPYYLKPNDPASNEFNLYFKRKGLDHNLMEKKLSLRNLPLYDGKFFWHFASPSLLTIEDDYYRLHKDLGDKIEQLELMEKNVNRLEYIIAEQKRELENIENQVRIAAPWVKNNKEFISWLHRSRVFKLIKFISR